MALRCRPRPEATLRGPWLVKTSTFDAAATPAAWRGLALTLRGLPSNRRAELVQATSDYLSAAEAKASPLVVDLLDDDAVPFDSVRAWFLPAWNTAAALVADSWPVPGTNWSVVPVRHVTLEARSSAWQAWPTAGRPSDPEGDRVRFAAWPVSHAILLDCGTDAGVARVVARLEAQIGDPSSSVGAWTVHPLLEPGPVAEFEAIRALALRAQKLELRAGRGTTDRWLEGLLSVVPENEPKSGLERWLDLAPNEILVAPRLGALARSARFLQEIREAASRAGVSGPRLDQP
jgi:hypothetical protein